MLENVHYLCLGNRSYYIVDSCSSHHLVDVGNCLVESVGMNEVVHVAALLLLCLFVDSDELELCLEKTEE